MQNNAPIILASESPRRRYLLSRAGLSFTVVPSQIDETRIPLSSPRDYVKTLAEKKAGAVSPKHPDSWVIGADTIVTVKDTILGKPDSLSEARSMLKRLSGEKHQVFTGYCICCHSAKHRISDAVSTDVYFKDLTAEEIEWYIHTAEPFDKAGAYAIQGLGSFLVTRINGSYTNVVGLPVCEVIEFFIRRGIIELKPTRGKDGKLN
jgi:septum formation protein